MPGAAGRCEAGAAALRCADAALLPDGQPPPLRAAYTQREPWFEMALSGRSSSHGKSCASPYTCRIRRVKRSSSSHHPFNWRPDLA